MTYSKGDIITKTVSFVRSKSEGESSGHDWWHIYRVHRMAKYLAIAEKADNFIVELAALLHDLDDWKFNHDGSNNAAEWLQKSGLDQRLIMKVMEVIEQVSFKGAGQDTHAETIEAQVVQDADRLDAIGAIGVARAFAYGGYKHRELYRPDVLPVLHNDFEAYRNNQSHTINHFYEKLLLLRDRMNTATAKKLAGKRHQFLEFFLSEFYEEWNFPADTVDQK